MSKTLQFRRGTSAELDAITGAEGEIFVDLDTNSLRIHDGNTAGGYSVTGTLSNLSDVDTTGVSSGQVLKYDGSQWIPATDLTANAGSGIALADLSVSTLPAGNAELSYNNTTGVFSFTPPDIGELDYTPDSGNTLQYVDGTYDFGSNIIKYANAIDQESDLSNYDPGVYHGMTMHVHSTGALYYAHAGAWRKLLTDTSHSNVESVGYVNPLANVAYDGDYNSLANTPSTAANFDELSDVTSAGIDINDIYESAIVTLRVNNNGTSAYTFDSHYTGDNPTVYAISGTTIAFDLDQIGGHPFELQDSGGTPISDGLVHVSATGAVNTGSSAQGFDSGTLYWRIQESLSGNYQYQCQFHGAMNGTITIKRLSTL